MPKTYHVNVARKINNHWNKNKPAKYLKPATIGERCVHCGSKLKRYAKEWLVEDTWVRNTGVFEVCANKKCSFSVELIGGKRHRYVLI